MFRNLFHRKSVNCAPAPLPDKPKEAFEAYVRELESHYEPWYDKASRRNYYLWLVAQVVAVFAGFATAIVAALIDHLQNLGPTLRILLIVLPILGSFAATLLVQTRLLERKALRERGRQAVQGLIARAKANFAAVESQADHSRLHRRLIRDVQSVEAEQATEFVRLAPNANQLSPKQTTESEDHAEESPT